MKIEVRYYTQTGNTKKLADAIASELNIEAKPVSENLDEKTDIVFICNSVYWAGINKNVKNFIEANKDKIGTLVNVSTAAIIESTYGQMKKIAKNANVKLCDKEFHCRGKFTGLHRQHPNDKDIEDLKKFVKEVLA